MGCRDIPLFIVILLVVGMLCSTNVLPPSLYIIDAFALEADGILVNNPPFVEILSATDAKGNVLASGDSIRVDSVTFEFNGTDDIALDRIGCSLQSMAHFENVSRNCSSPISYSGLSPGVYQFGVAAVDLAGNSALVTFHFTIEPEISQHTYCDLPWYFYNVIDGSVEGDLLNGTELNDLIRGFGGDDVIDGNGGNDCITGNGGDDVLLGGPGDDGIYGGIGDDEIHGNDGDDTSYGNSGDDLISGGDGDDYIAGKVGSDSMFGNNGDDKMFGNEGDDFLKGGDGDDIMFGGEGHDVLMGNTGADRLAGQDDEDALTGGRGDDRLSGGDGLDELDGGKDRDKCYDVPQNFAAIPPLHCEERLFEKDTVIFTDPDPYESSNPDFDLDQVGFTTSGDPFVTVHGTAGGTQSTSPGIVFLYFIQVSDGPDDDGGPDRYVITSHGGVEDSTEVDDDLAWHAHRIISLDESDACSPYGDGVEIVLSEDGTALITPQKVILEGVKPLWIGEVATSQIDIIAVDGHVCVTHAVNFDLITVPGV
jgi:hypothetical protein